MEYA
jgi:mitogen-activated protein kinase 1/3